MPPEHPVAYFERGNVLLARGRAKEAEASYREALALDPLQADVHNHLGTALQGQNRMDEAVACYRRALELRADDPDIYYNLGNALFAQGKIGDAEEAYRRAVALEPNRAEFHNNLGNALAGQRKLDEAVDAYRRAGALDPQHYRARFNLGNAFFDQAKSDEAIGSYRQAIEIKPDYAAAYNNLAQVLKARGQAHDAVPYYRKAAELAPDDPARYSNLLFCLHYDPAMTPGALYLEHRTFEAAFPAVKQTVHANPREPNKRLNIGYLSPDLRVHPVGFFLLPVLATHNRESVAAHCYYTARQSDGVTNLLSSHAEVWRSVADSDDEALATLIQADAIDILVDLSGHTAGNRLGVFGRRPAPVQVSWAGYVGTTGLSAIDYLISDRWHTPEGSERYVTEALVRLPNGYVCWAPPGHSPDITGVPAVHPGAVTFGCFNNLAKINPPVIALWSRLLRELPAARLLLKTRELGDAAACQRLLQLFAIEDIAPERILLEASSPHFELLQRYNDTDIALDPFPYSGGLTTIEALWMGVPVITMPGERFCSRHSLSHLSVVGHPELVAGGPDEYVRIAIELARDLPRLTALRAGLRAELHASPLVQAERFTRSLEKAFRLMWQRWCDGTQERNHSSLSEGP